MCNVKRFSRGSVFLLVAVVLIAVQLACGGTGQDVPVSTATTGKESQADAPSKEVQLTEVIQPTKAVDPTEEVDPTEVIESTVLPSSPSASAGLACITFEGLGVSCLDEVGWHVFTAEEIDEDSGRIFGDVAACTDGNILVSHPSGFSSFDGREWKEYEGEWGPMACDADGGIWVAHYEGVSYFDGSDWTTYPSSLLATGEAADDLVYDVAVAPDGRVWVATPHSIAAYNGEEWTVFQKGQGLDEEYHFKEIAIDSEGRLWALHSSGVLVYEDGTWASKEEDGLFLIESLTIDLEDRVWVGTRGQGIFVLEKDGNWTQYNRKTSGLGSDEIRDMTVDAGGRVWVGTEWGIHIFDGVSWTGYHMDNADLLENEVTGIAVAGGGPPLPEPLEKEPGSLVGQLLFPDGQPAVGIPVEICVEKVGVYSGPTPCSDQPFMLSTETDDEGRFVFSDVPPGFYILTAKIGDKWGVLSKHGWTSQRIPVEVGSETDLEIINVKREE